MNFSIVDIAKTVTSGSDIMANREKAKIGDIIGRDVTLKDFDRVQVLDKKEKEFKDVWVVVFYEMPEYYFFGGKAINSILDSALEVYGDVMKLREEYGKGEQLKIHLDRVNTQNGNSFTKVTVI